MVGCCWLMEIEIHGLVDRNRPNCDLPHFAENWRITASLYPKKKTHSMGEFAREHSEFNPSVLVPGPWFRYNMCPKLVPAMMQTMLRVLAKQVETHSTIGWMLERLLGKKLGFHESELCPHCFLLLDLRGPFCHGIAQKGWLQRWPFPVVHLSSGNFT